MRQNDAFLVAQVLAGDKAAFGPLVVRHQSRAMRLALRMLGERADAEDVVQEALLQAFLNVRALRVPDRFGAWLLGIVVNLCRMRLRTRTDGYTVDDWSGGRVWRDTAWVDTQPSPEMMYEVRALHHVVLGAIATLPVAQQEAVRLYYFEGLTLKEMSFLSRIPLGTAKARLQRARARLRQTLERKGEEVWIPVPQVVEEVAMIEVTVHDVMMWVPKHEKVHWPGARQDYKKYGTMALVLLKEQDSQRLLPMLVGRGEGNALAMQLSMVETPRPMTFDLMAQLAEAGENQVHQVTVSQLHEKTFFATVWLHTGARFVEVDARPSDAFNLALRVNAPIFVAPEIFDRVSLSLNKMLPEIEARYQYQKIEPSEETEMELRSFRTLPWEEGIGWLIPPKK